MKNLLVSHVHVLRLTLRRFLTTPLSSLLNILVFGIALSLPAGMYLLLKSVQSLAEQEVGTQQISIFLSMDASRNEVTQIGKQLKQHVGINEVKFVPRDQALEQLKQTTGLTDVIGGMEQNPLPDAYIIYPETSDAEALEALRDELQKWPNFEHVQLDSAWAYKLEAMLKFGLLAVLFLAVLLSVALVAVTFNTIRLQILTQREEIEVSKLIGATNAFIRRPFLYFGLLQGLMGGAVAWVLITVSLYLLNSSLSELTHLYTSNFALLLPSVGDSTTLLLLSAYLGWLGAWLSVAQHLWKIEPR
ncbi:permease-like cell division protein FtsX [Candidatus Nitrotoga sp. M5]|uniref:permease-like cell division protein FtsX n=1 Tax=Candidatus Nitrotoga sp. M5 TaxID=2890409 RepID=UPI001EF35A55|nr:permease-like cell division protein FtsX [Candidatus Nitrotoga sp. M5]CAH1386294.1 Cell division protein FtsX [Candidatus Nitrotoga sp. M5]